MPSEARVNVDLALLLVKSGRAWELCDHALNCVQIRKAREEGRWGGAKEKAKLTHSNHETEGAAENWLGAQSAAAAPAP